MKLKKIQKINTASFRNFSWTSRGLEEFTDNTNIILGWNGTGKTVVSRILRSYEKEQLSENLDNDAEFSLIFNSNTCTQTDLIGFKNKIRVFNEDYIKEKMKSGSDSFPHVVYIGDEAIDYSQKEINKKDLEAKLKKIKCEDNFSILKTNARDTVKRVNGLLGLKKQFELGKYSAYDTNSVEKNISEITNKIENDGLNISSLKLNEDEEKLLREELNNQAGKKKVFSKLKEWSDWFVDNIDSINNILKKNPTQTTSDRINRYKEEQKTIKWIEDGVSIHNLNTDNPSNKCSFCNSQIDNSDELIKHFSKEVIDLNKDIENYIDELISLERDLKEVDDFYIEEKDTLLKIMEDIKKQLKEKTNDISITDFKSFDFKSFFEDDSELESDLSGIAYKLENHYIANMYNNYISKKNTFEQCSDDKKKIEEKISVLNKEIQGLKDKERNIKIPADSINELLKIVFPYKKIELSGADDGFGYKITRNGRDCSLGDLSEGERNFIALAYFLKTLNTEDIKNKLDNEGIVVIDDPISSLDKNSLFQIFAVLVSEIKMKPNRQYFIFTHNLDFFAHIFKHFENREKNDDKNTIRQNGFYQIHHGVDGSRIGKIHKMLKQFQTDYRYATSVLFKMKDGTEPEDAYLAVNMLRRVWETFIHFKFGSGDLRSKLPWVYDKAAKAKIVKEGITDLLEKKKITNEFANNQVMMYKFIHHGSHEFQSIDKLDDAIFGEFRKRIENFFEIVKILDEYHYKQIYKKQD